MDNFMIAVVVLLVAIFSSRIINEKANKKLEQDKKAALIDIFSNNRIWTYGVLIAIVVLFYISLRFNLINPVWTYIIYIVSLIAYILTISYNSYIKLKANDFPSSYIKSYILSTALRLLGILIFVAILDFY